MATLLEPSPDPLPPAAGHSAQSPVFVPVSSQRAAATRDPMSSTMPGSGAVAASASLTNTAFPTATRETSTPKRPVRSATTRIPPTSRPLVPATERRSVQPRSTTAARGLGLATTLDTDNSHNLLKYDINLEGGPSAREGRQFTVANVGNNGRIYLRPTVRPANQRCPQPQQSSFPITPPSTAGLDPLAHDRSADDVSSDLHISQWTPTPRASPFGPDHSFFSGSPDPNRPAQQRRPLSDSTVQEANIAKESDTGDLKIIISKPGDNNRPRTMEDFDPNNTPQLDINIPSWRIGTPRFTVSGSPLIRGSSFAPTEDFRSSVASMLRPQGEMNNNSRRHSTLAVPSLRFSLSSSSSPSSRQTRPIRPSYVSYSKIEPAMFDNLTFKPACDDRTLVRYSPATGAVTAATPPRLVAEITSPSFLDYELISDFFLTFRAFLESAELLRMLVARLKWALARQDETGLVVRVRTFVALRHWILNYFMDDFVLDYNLRLIFCELMNDFVAELSESTKSRKVPIKILGELKKCWRRVCALYWDGPDFDDTLDANVPVTPGGIAGHRDPALDPTFWDGQEEEPLPRDSMFRRNTLERTSFIAEISRGGQVGDTIVYDNRPSTPEHQMIPEVAVEEQQSPASPISMASLDIVSCSIPKKKSVNSQAPNPLGAHPVTAVNSQAGQVATTPRALVGKRVRPAPPAHKRNNSLTDSLRDHTSDKLSFKDQEFLMTVPYAGSLVRGNLLPPAQAFVDIEMDDLPRGGRMVTTPLPDDAGKERSPGGAMSGHGMKKLIGSVRRALSTRAQGTSSPHGSFINVASIGPRGATTNRLPGTAVVPQGRYRSTGARPPVRIDMLGAEVAEDFKKAVREEAAAEAERRGIAASPNSTTSMPADLEFSTAHLGTNMLSTNNQGGHLRPVSDMAITAGSKSIVIVDDTSPFDVAGHHHEIASVPPSVDAFAETFHLGGDPTPPTTPPAPSVRGTPRRSSYLLNQHVIQPSLSEDPLPPFVPDLDTLSPTHSPRASQDTTRQTASQKSGRPYPPVSFRGHRRNKSSRTHMSLNSMLQKRRFSAGSVMGMSSSRSFDATSFSGTSVRSDDPEVTVPQPLRVLRRRPGGDLRAATNVGELDQGTLRKSRSVGSLTSYSGSARSSFLYSPRVDSFGNDLVSVNYGQSRSEVFSLGQLAEKPPPRDLSLFSTHSSKPVMRPSFEIEAQRLAQIPDDDDDDGGIEAALLKLEGKYVEKKPKQQDVIDPAEIGIALGEPQMENQERLAARQTFMLDPDQDEPRPSTPKGGFLSPTQHGAETRSFLSSSQESYSSIPILDRDGTDDGLSGRETLEWANLSILEGPDEDVTPKQKNKYAFLEDEEGDSQRTSFNIVDKTKSIERIKPGETKPQGADEDESFFNDDSDLSSEMSIDAVEGEFDHERGFHRVNLPAHPLGSPVPTPMPKRSPPSPPMTLVQALEMSPPQSFKVPEIHDDQVYGRRRLPPTPETTPTAPYVMSTSSFDSQTAAAEALRTAPRPEPTQNRYTVHLPFILAFDSEILAQQFTLIEKDALNEIDWKELIDMNWKNATNNDSRSWVDFLRNTNAHGVEVVIARFNIVVKWAISEIVMTQDMAERARCITKFIHIANHCRRYRNFATLAQLTIALSSNEVSRLTRTWSVIPPHDLKTLRELENLVTPMRNFYNLRAEMEIGSDLGCIPFVGIYTHDLLYNAQRPSEIAGSPTTAPLVNFERCRIAAAVVKTLLRLLEASTRYKFQPIEGITERCLWMSALTDDEIRQHSESLE